MVICNQQKQQKREREREKEKRKTFSCWSLKNIKNMKKPPKNSEF